MLQWLGFRGLRKKPERCAFVKPAYHGWRPFSTSAAANFPTFIAMQRFGRKPRFVLTKSHGATVMPANDKNQFGHRAYSILIALGTVFLLTGNVLAQPLAIEPTGSGRQADALVLTQVVPLGGGPWLLATDPGNKGRQEKWFLAPRPQAKPAAVPGVVQEIDPDYHGVAWYWRDFEAPAKASPGGRYLLRFRAVDYLAEVWLNGVRVGLHEGAQEPFVLDATDAVRPDASNRLAVRVLSPSYDLIDGICLTQVAEGRRQYPYVKDNAYATGGIIDSVELLVAPATRIEDLQVMPDWKSGDVRVLVNVRNAGRGPAAGQVRVSIAPATAGESIATTVRQRDFAPGDTLLEARLSVPHHRLWELKDPYLYRVTAQVQTGDSRFADERSVRCGFRDFRFEDGYFRLNGRRLRLHGPLYTVLNYPVTQSVAYDEDLLRRDVLNMKALGFNIVRIHCGSALPARQLDVCDELGLLACEEHFGARAIDDSPRLEKRWDDSISSVIRRDRNHPSVVIWSLLNEVGPGRLFRHVAGSLPMIRGLDESRLVLLNSGRFDGDASLGSMSKPGSAVWEKNDLADVHDYPSFPHSADTINHMRHVSAGHPMLLSEYGVCGAQDYARFMRHFEQLGKESAPDARLFREKLDRFLADWKKWQLDQCWARPEDYFRESQQVQAALALDDYNAWMANPSLVGDYTSTQIVDAWFHGCGLTNYFRELKPGMADAYTDMAAPVRLCLFVEPQGLYRGAKARLEAVLVDLDALRPGKYPLRLQVVGPQMTRILDRTIVVEVPAQKGKREPPFARQIFGEDLPIDGPAGKYRFLATFQRGAAAGGGLAEFYVDDRAAMPAVADEIVLWGEDAALGKLLSACGIRSRPFTSQQTAREVILVSGRAPAPGGGAVFSELARHMARGSMVVFLTPECLADPKSAKNPWNYLPVGRLRWAPFPATQRPELGGTPDWYFRADPWAKVHPIFAGLPSGGIMDYRYYRGILGPEVFVGLQPPLEAVCGALQTSGGGDDYRSDLTVSIHRFGAGRFILNSLHIRGHLGKLPAAERLLRNMLNVAAQGTNRPLADLPADFAAQLAAMQYDRN